MIERYLPRIPNGRWAIGGRVNGRLITLVQDTSLDYPDDACAALCAVEMEPTLCNLDTFFPIRRGQGRCPTLDFLEIFSQIGRKTYNPGV